MTEKVEHYQVEQRYKIIIERAASTKGIDGFKVEANGDVLSQVESDALTLYENAKGLTSPVISGSIAGSKVDG